MAEMEEKMRTMLLTFIDILYAVVYGLILVQAYEQVIMPAKPLGEKASNTLLVIGVFYFLTWDWLHARRLTLKNPYTRYRRFFYEVLISFLAYGAALNALKMQVFLLIYIFLGLLMGAIWARSSLKEYSASEDQYELRFIFYYQTAYALVGTGIFLYQYYYISKAITLRESLIFVALGYLFILIYDILVERPSGIMGGPSVPFISRNTIDWVRKLFR